MKLHLKQLFFIIIFSTLLCTAYGQNSLRTISGRITDGKIPLNGVSILNEQQSTLTQTNDKGRYEVVADEGDVLVFGYLGRDTVRIKTEDVTRFLNIEMRPKAYELSGVTVSDLRDQKAREAPVKYVKNKGIVRTAYGVLEQASINFASTVIDGDVLDIGAVNFGQALRGRLHGVIRGGVFGSNIGEIYLRGGNGMHSRHPAGYDVDGMVMRDMPNFLDIQNIDRIMVLPSLGAVTKYGEIGKGGMIIINTKRQKYASLGEESGEIYDYAKRRDNIYSNDALSPEEIEENQAFYLRELLSAESTEHAKTIYRKHESIYKSSYSFVLDSYAHFFVDLNDQSFAEMILNDNWGVFESNPVALKALAYLYQANKKYKKANDVYKKIFLLRPNYTQSYFDLAKSYEDLGNFSKSALLLLRYDYLTKEGFFPKSTGKLNLTLARELNNLVTLHGKRVLPSKSDKKLTFKENIRGKRLVFEWNDSEAEFELQFVSPPSNFHKWSHTINENAAVIADEKNLGYSMSEYFIDHSLGGDWKVNIKYLGNKQLTPSYLKVTIYHDYGLATQRKEVKTFRLGVKNVNQKLFALNTPKEVLF